MDQEKKKFLDRERTRRDFLKLTGKSIGGAVVSLSILNLFGIEAEAAQAYALPQGLLIADKSKCTGCQRCETLCSSIHDGKVQPFISRIHVSENYNFGQDGPKLNYIKEDGQFGNFKMNPDTCKQCREPFCGRACPVGAITADTKWKNARTVNKEKCVGCGACVKACPWKMPKIDPEAKKASKCVTCGMCADNCPTGALTVISWEDVKIAMNKNKHLFV